MTAKPKQPAPTLGTCERCHAAVGVVEYRGRIRYVGLEKRLFAILEDGPHGPVVREWKQGFEPHPRSCADVADCGA